MEYEWVIHSSNHYYITTCPLIIPYSATSTDTPHFTLQHSNIDLMRVHIYSTHVDRMNDM